MTSDVGSVEYALAVIRGVAADLSRRQDARGEQGEPLDEFMRNRAIALRDSAIDIENALAVPADTPTAVREPLEYVCNDETHRACTGCDVVRESARAVPVAEIEPTDESVSIGELIEEFRATAEGVWPPPLALVRDYFWRAFDAGVLVAAPAVEVLPAATEPDPYKQAGICDWCQHALESHGPIEDEPERWYCGECDRDCNPAPAEVPEPLCRWCKQPLEVHTKPCLPVASTEANE